METHIRRGIDHDKGIAIAGMDNGMVYADILKPNDLYVRLGRAVLIFTYGATVEAMPVVIALPAECWDKIRVRPTAAGTVITVTFTGRQG